MGSYSQFFTNLLVASQSRQVRTQPGLRESAVNLETIDWLRYVISRLSIRLFKVTSTLLQPIFHSLPQLRRLDHGRVAIEPTLSQNQLGPFCLLILLQSKAALSTGISLKWVPTANFSQPYPMSVIASRTLFGLSSSKALVNLRP
jgi:hypothetical protein